MLENSKNYGDLKGINGINIPKFVSYLRCPNDPTCKIIDSTRLLVEVLGGIKPASNEFAESELSSNVMIDGKFSLVLRYKTKNSYYPVCTLGFDEDDLGITINQLQGTKKKGAFAFNASFNTVRFFVDLIEESFHKKGIFVNIKSPGLFDCDGRENLYNKYKQLVIGIEVLNKKYFGKESLNSK